MTTEILICTTIKRLSKVEKILLPPQTGISYLIGIQGGVPTAEQLAPFLRSDIRTVWMQEMGLSRNRNLVLHHARADLLVIADDDNMLVAETIAGLTRDFNEHPHWDIIQYRMSGSGKPFPAIYVSSCELVMRRRSIGSLRFDVRFGLGSEHLASGEEEVFVFQAIKKGLQMGQLDKPLCKVEGATTGDFFLTNPRVQRSKGAVFALTRGRWWALYRCTRETMGYMLRQGVNPLPLLRNMWWGISYVSA